MTDVDVFINLGIATGLGLLVGLQRQRSASQIAGIRTFPLITLLGALCGLVSLSHGGWTIAAGFLAVAAVVVTGNMLRRSAGHADPGITTEIATLVMYGVGVYVVVGSREPAIVTAAVTAILLHIKKPLHRFISAMEEKEVHAIMRFVLIALVILPVLPDRAFGPYSVWNPRNIWLVVVLIVGINLAGYIAYKLIGGKAGTILSGVLGGLISSTATTVSFARQSTSARGGENLGALVIIIASAVAYGRVIVEIAAVAPGSLAEMAIPIAAVLGVEVLLVAGWYFLARKQDAKIPEPGNPAELKPAVIFAALYAVVLLVVAAAKHYFDTAGLYVAAGVSGLTDLDAITLSTARLVHEGQVDAAHGWRAVLLASISNMVFKAGIVASLGSRALLWRVAMLFGMVIAAAVLAILLWPSPAAGS